MNICIASSDLESCTENSMGSSDLEYLKYEIITIYFFIMFIA